MNSDPLPPDIEELAERLFARDHPVRVWRPHDAISAAADGTASQIEHDLYRAFATRRCTDQSPATPGASRRSRTPCSKETR